MTESTVRNIVLTGVSRGLGRAMLEEFIRLGHSVHGCARSERGIDALRGKFGPPHSWEVVDVSCDEKVASWAARVLERTGGQIDLLVNNAACINPNAPLWEVPDEEFSRVVDVNIKGVANCIRRFVPAMIARGQGVIVNFSSGWGRSTSPEVGPYCATKWAIEGLTKALAQELPSGMAAVPLNPGIIDTDMLRSCFGDHSGAYGDPASWATRAVPQLLRLGPRDNGDSLSVK